MTTATDLALVVELACPTGAHTRAELRQAVAS